MKIILPPAVKLSINQIGNKTIQSKALIVYAHLLLKNKYANQFGFFDCPSSYLKSIHSSYSRVLRRFLSDGVLEYRKGIRPDPNDIFNTIETKYYNTWTGDCINYRFIIDISQGEEIEVNFHTRNRRWYQITMNSLLELGYEPKIKRDHFGMRIHHPAIQTYKEDLKGRGFSLIDARASQPRLLYLLMKRKEIVDSRYFEIFERGYDFYLELVKRFDLKDRDSAKELFLHWINGKGYVPNSEIYSLFPIASKFIKELKSKSYKNSAKFLQREEAKIWIDDLLNYLPVEFALPVHDCLIVKQKDCNEVLEYCKGKYPEIDFRVDIL